LAGRGALVRFTVDDVLAMIDAGIIAEDATTELLHGMLVRKDRSDLGDDPTVIGKKHRLVVNKLTDLAMRINSVQQHIQIQNPVICGEDEAPEPDFAIVRGPIDAYADRLPIGADVTCVAEVADSSLERDADEKLSVYAAAGVLQYIVLNLRNRTAQVYAEPDLHAATYRSTMVLAESQILYLTLAADRTLAVPLAELLP
jgi:Uma2 family endonuclease